MKNLFLTILAVSVCAIPPALAGEKSFTKAEIHSLARKVKARHESAKRELRNRLAIRATPIVKFFTAPETPIQGDSVSIFSQMDTGFLDQETILLGTLDGQSIALEHPAAELWIAAAGRFTEIRSHEFKVRVFLQSASDAAALREAISQLEIEIAALNEQISGTTDPDLLAQLIAQRDEKEAQKALLIQALSDLKSPIGEETFTFKISENSLSPDFPHISSIVPNVARLGHSQEVTITGTNFGPNPSVLVGGAEALVTSATATQIQGVVPAISAPGIKSVEVRYTENNQIKNALIANGLFVTPDFFGNFPPVAVVTAAQPEVLLGSEATFGAEGSYDPEGAPIRLEWRLIAKPRASALPLNVLMGTEPVRAFTPDVVGSYVIELRVFEVSGQQLASTPALGVVAVGNNQAPVGSAPAITVGMNGTRTSQVSASDPDSQDVLAYSIPIQPQLGTASVSSDGLVTYQANPEALGVDNIAVVVKDQGLPIRSTTVNIPVAIIANQAPVVPSPLGFAIRTQGLPYQVGLSTSPNALPEGGIVDPDGTIESILWTFGDGTKERVFDLARAAVLHDYVAVGEYSAVLKVTDNLGTSTSRTIQVNVVDTDIPVAKFTVSPSNGGGGTLPLTVTFDASASSDSDGVTQYRWRFGNDATTELVTTNPVVTKTFEIAGNYGVRLRVRDAHFGQGEATVRVTVGSTVNGAPSQPLFQVGPPRQVALGTSHAFDAARAFNPNLGGSLIAYNWNFGDPISCPHPNGGCTATGLTASHTYPHPVNFFPSLQVQNNSGGLSQRINMEAFVVNQGHAPRAVIRASGTSGVAPFVMSYDGTESYDYDGQVVGCSFRTDPFETSVPGCTGSHTYSTPGVYIAQIIATDNHGNSHLSSETITVLPARSDLPKELRIVSNDPDREYQRKVLAGACGAGDGEACSNLADMFAEDGDTYTSTKLKERACALGHQPACTN